MIELKGLFRIMRQSLALFYIETKINIIDRIIIFYPKPRTPIHENFRCIFLETV